MQKSWSFFILDIHIGTVINENFYHSITTWTQKWKNLYVSWCFLIGFIQNYHTRLLYGEEYSYYHLWHSHLRRDQWVFAPFRDHLNREVKDFILFRYFLDGFIQNYRWRLLYVGELFYCYLCYSHLHRDQWEFSSFYHHLNKEAKNFTRFEFLMQLFENYPLRLHNAEESILHHFGHSLPRRGQWEFSPFRH